LESFSSGTVLAAAQRHHEIVSDARDPHLSDADVSVNAVLAMSATARCFAAVSMGPIAESDKAAWVLMHEELASEFECDPAARAPLPFDRAYTLEELYAMKYCPSMPPRPVELKRYHNTWKVMLGAEGTLPLPGYGNSVIFFPTNGP